MSAANRKYEQAIRDEFYAFFDARPEIGVYRAAREFKRRYGYGISGQLAAYWLKRREIERQSESAK